jgi:hypothetical protein
MNPPLISVSFYTITKKYVSFVNRQKNLQAAEGWLKSAPICDMVLKENNRAEVEE